MQRVPQIAPVDFQKFLYASVNFLKLSEKRKIGQFLTILGSLDNLHLSFETHCEALGFQPLTRSIVRAGAKVVAASIIFRQRGHAPFNFLTSYIQWLPF